MIMQITVIFNSEVKIMEIQEILDIIKAFFDAVIRIFETLGLVKSDDATTEGDETTGA